MCIRDSSHTYQMGKRVETWNGKLPQRDWAALENNWASAYTCLLYTSRCV